MAPVAAPVTDAARTVIGPDDVATAGRGIIGVVVIVRIISAVEETPVVKEVPVMMPEREPAMAKAATAEHMTGAKSAAMEHMTGAESTAMERSAAAAEAAAMKDRAAAVETAPTS